MELKIQRLVDINRGEEDDPLINERQSRDFKTIKKIQKIKTAGENEEVVRQLSYTVLRCLTLSYTVLECLDVLMVHV